MSQMPLLGADTTELRTLRQKLDAFSEEIRRVGATTTVQLEMLSWFGADRTAFHDQWTGTYHPSLVRIAGAVTDAGVAVEEQAADQDRASSGTGASGAATGAVARAAGAGAAGVAGATGAGTTGATGTTGTAAGTTGQAGAGAGAAGGAGVQRAANAGDEDLGALSRRYESNGNPGTVSTGRGDHGGVSYGTYQFSSTQGTAREFVNSLRESHPDYYQALSGSRPGTPEFGQAWRDLAARDAAGFTDAQHDFIQATHYQPQYDAVQARLPGINLADRDPVVRDVLWSTAVQHRNATDDIFARATAGQDVSRMSDADLVRAVYAERGRDDGMAYFRSSSPRVRAGVVDRFDREQADALTRLGQ